MRTLDAKRVEQPQDVLAQLIDRVRPRGNRRTSMPACVVPQDAVLATERGDLWLPQAQR